MNPSDLEARFRTLLIVCGVIALSLFMVNVVIAILHVSGSLPAGTLSREAAMAVLVVALILLVAAPAAKRAVFKRAGAEEGFEREPEQRLKAYSTGTIVGFAVREAAGLLGFAVALLTGDPGWSWGLGGAALLAMVLDRPRREHLGALP